MGASQPGATADITLMAYMGMGPVQGLVKTRVFGGPYLRFADFASVSGYLYQAGAIIARAKLDKLMLLAKMITLPGHEQEMLDWARDLAEKRFDEFLDVYGEEPRALPVLFLATEYRKAGILIPLAGLGQITETNTKQIRKVAAAKMPLQQVEPRIKEAMLEGLGFGTSFPELTEKMYREANEAIDEEQWSQARQHGLHISETPTIITLEEQEEIQLSMVAAYAQAYHPDLVDALGLADLVE